MCVFIYEVLGYLIQLSFRCSDPSLVMEEPESVNQSVSSSNTECEGNIFYSYSYLLTVLRDRHYQCIKSQDRIRLAVTSDNVVSKTQVIDT